MKGFHYIKWGTQAKMEALANLEVMLYDSGGVPI